MMRSTLLTAARALVAALLLVGPAGILPAAGEGSPPVDCAAFTVEAPATGSGWTLRPDDQSPIEVTLQRDPWAPGVRAYLFASSTTASLPKEDPSPEALLAKVKLLHGRSTITAKPPEITAEAGEFQGRPAAYFRSVAVFSGATLRGGPDMRVVTRGVYVRVPGRPLGLTAIHYVEMLPVGTEEKATDQEARAILEKVKLK